MRKVVELCIKLGWKINFKKSDLVLAKKKQFLRFIINVEKEPKLRISYQKKRFVKRKILKLLKKASIGTVSIKKIAKVVGLCQVLTRVFVIMPIYLRVLIK
jgi:hypothetical protein